MESPIVYKRLNFNKFANIDEDDNDKGTIVYDEISEKIIQLNDDSIKIFNKKLTNLKKSLSLKLTKNRVNLLTVDKQLRFLLIVVDGKSILVINLRVSKVIDIININCSNLKGLFFIGNNDTSKQAIFCLMFYQKLIFYKIEIQGKQGEEAVEIVHEPKHVNLNYTISDFSYCSYYSVLMLYKQNQKGQFEFFNLNYEKNFSKSYPYSFKQNGKLSTENQFFLKTLYFKLMLICLSIDDQQIQVNQIYNLQNIERILSFDLKVSPICTLQFIDNLIIYHDFVLKNSLIVDIKSENPNKPLLNQQPITSKSVLDNNEEKMLELIDLSIYYEDNGDVDLEINYNKVTLETNNSTENKKICKI